MAVSDFAFRPISHVSRSFFLREAAWVILCSGFRETTVRGLFQPFSRAFHDWGDELFTTPEIASCRDAALQVFRYRGKVDAICEIAMQLRGDGFTNLSQRLIENGYAILESLPFIGPVTARHLAKNIGIQVAKPDRHMVRIAALAGFDCTDEFCSEIAATVPDTIIEIDSVVWRFATIRPDYREWVSSRISGSPMATFAT